MYYFLLAKRERLVNLLAIARLGRRFWINLANPSMALSLAAELGSDYENIPGASSTRALHEESDFDSRDGLSDSLLGEGEFLVMFAKHGARYDAQSHR